MSCSDSGGTRTHILKIKMSPTGIESALPVLQVLLDNCVTLQARRCSSMDRAHASEA